MRTAFAIALLAFVGTSNAVKLAAMDESSDNSSSSITSESCTGFISTDIRDPMRTDTLLASGWTDAYNVFKQISDFTWPQTDIKSCQDQSLRNQSNQCLTWLGMATDQYTGANSGYADWKTCGHENGANQGFNTISTYQLNDNLGNDQGVHIYQNTASNLCLNGDGLLTDDCQTGVMHRSKISVDQHNYLRNVGTGECLIPLVNEENARVVSTACENDPNQEWIVFGNSEIVHVATGYCLGTSYGKMGVLSISSCVDILEQGFKPSATSGKMQFTWMADESKSLEAVSFEGNAVAPRATSQAEVQFWQFVNTNEWNDAEFKWVEVGCGNGVEMSHSYSEEFTAIDSDGVRSQASDDFVLSARDELYGQTEITNAPAVDADSVEYLTQTYSDMMNHPSDPTIDRSHLFTCSGDNNCMYRSVMSMFNNLENESLEWITGYTRCLPNEPVCPPLTVYDETDSKCIVSE